MLEKRRRELEGLEAEEQLYVERLNKRPRTESSTQPVHDSRDKQHAPVKIPPRARVVPVAAQPTSSVKTAAERPRSPVHHHSRTPPPGSDHSADPLEVMQDDLDELEADPEACDEERADLDSVEPDPCNEDEDDDSFDDELTAEKYATTIAELEAASKRRHSIDSTGTPAYQLNKIGRRMPVLFGPYVHYGQIITNGLSICALGPMNTHERKKRITVCARNSDEPSVAHHLLCFERLMETFPFMELFLPFVINSNKRVKTTHVYMISTYMEHHARASLSSDVFKIKDQVLTYLPTVVTTHDLVIKPLREDQKNKARNFGYYSMCTGRLCTAINQISEFDKNPERYCFNMTHMTDEAQKQLALASVSLPAYLFREDVVGNYDPDSPSEGAYQSLLVMKGYRHLVTGKSSAHNKPGERSAGGRASLGRQWRCTRVLPELVAYVASLFEFVLSSRPQWSSEDPGGKKQDLYDRVLEYMKGEEEEFLEMTPDEIEEDHEKPGENLMSWWNRWVYGTPVGDPYNADDYDPARHLIEDAPNVRQNVIESRTKEREARREARERAQPAATMEPSTTPPRRPDNARISPGARDGDLPSDHGRASPVAGPSRHRHLNARSSSPQAGSSTRDPAAVPEDDDDLYA